MQLLLILLCLLCLNIHHHLNLPSALHHLAGSKQSTVCFTPTLTGVPRNELSTRTDGLKTCLLSRLSIFWSVSVDLENSSRSSLRWRLPLKNTDRMALQLHHVVECWMDSQTNVNHRFCHRKTRWQSLQLRSTLVFLEIYMNSSYNQLGGRFIDWFIVII